MRIGLHVGLTTVGNDVLEVLSANQNALADHDWTVAPEEHDFLPPEEEPQNLARIVAQTTDGWASWLPSAQAAGAVMSCVHLGDALLVGGQADEVVAQLEEYGEVSGGALVRRIDDYIAARYVLELFAGRVRRLSDRELAGGGPNNYFPAFPDGSLLVVLSFGRCCVLPQDQMQNPWPNSYMLSAFLTRFTWTSLTHQTSSPWALSKPKF